ncbi:DUF748 domain-containing protein [Castellaniella ginsengisoli]|uniref:DUF748 domain-containing protein n=1 Tax=Castellaniella ginsengisoli TaxID=546114 RepID=A0AB39FPP7_9BURK
MQWRMPVLKLGRRGIRILAGIVLTLLALAALSAWWVPKAVRGALTQDVSELLGRQVQVGEIRFNPFTLALRAQDLVIGQPQSEPLLRVGEIDLRVAWRSLVLFAPVIDRIRVDRPHVALVRQDIARFNFSDIIDRLAARAAGRPAEPEPADAGPPRFSLNNLSLTGGEIHLDDHVTGRQQTVDEITLGIPFLSSLGYATDIDVQPAVHLRINGSPFDLRGKARPFDTIPTSTLDVTLDGVALDKWADFWPLPLPVRLKSALLDSRLQVLFEQPPAAAPRIRVQGSLGLRALDLAELSDAPLLAWDNLRAEGLALDLETRTASIDTVTLSGPRVTAHRDAQQFNWQRVAEGFVKLGAAGPGTQEPAPQAPGDPAPEATPPKAPAPTATSPGQPATPAAEPQDAEPQDAEPQDAGPKRTGPPAAAPAWRFALGAFKLEAGALHLSDGPSGLDYPLDGLNAEVEHITWPQAPGQPMRARLSLDNSLDGSTLRIESPLSLQPLSAQAQVRLGNLALAPFAAAVRHVSPIALLDGRLDLEGTVTVADTRIEARDVTLGLQHLAARDESVKPGVELSIGSLALAADRLALDDTPASFTLKAVGIQKQGTLALDGSLTAQPLSVKTSVDLARFDAASLAPYIASSLNATVRGATLGARGQAEFTAPQGGRAMRADWRGAVQLDGLDLQDRVNKTPFLNWKHLGLSKMRVSMAGPKLVLGLGDIQLTDFYGNILLNDKARLNVMDILVDEGTAGGSITQDTQTRRVRAAGTTARGKTPAAPEISIRSVTLKRGRVTFNDHFVRPNYRAELSAIEGTLTAVSSTRPAPAKVRVSGRVYGTAPFSLAGTVQPFARYLALDLEASAKGVDLPRFTTYSAKYVGYAIERGKLSVDLHYEIKDRALQASNKVLLNQLTFGQPSGSPDALKLPVLLAVALLKDANGNIDINLPVSGSLDDPEFSVGGIIVRVIVNTVVKAVTAPFSLLASAFGGGEDLSRIEFAPGRATLDDTAKSSIATLVKALADRPALKMDIIGRADPATDEAGLRQAWLDDKIRAAKAKATGGGKKAAAGVELTDADRAQYLEDVYDDAKIKNKPRNAIGFAKSLPPEQMHALLLAAAPLDKQPLLGLAQARAQAVYEQILADAPELTDRVFIVAPKPDASGIEDGGAATRVDFALH